MTRSASAPFKRVAGSDGIEYLIKTHLTACEAIYKRQDFWTVLESKKYDLFVTQLLGSGCDSYIAYKLQIPMIAVTTSAMPTWYIFIIKLTSYFFNLFIPSVVYMCINMNPVY